jgi:hypothetical protein
VNVVDVQLHVSLSCKRLVANRTFRFLDLLVDFPDVDLQVGLLAEHLVAVGAFELLLVVVDSAANKTDLLKFHF